MKRILFILINTILALNLFAQERIAVFPFEDVDNVFMTQNEALFLYRQFSNEFTNKMTSRLTIVPRADVEKLINMEKNFQLSDLSEKAKTAEYQRVLNGTQILSGMVGKVGSKIMVSISLYTYPELKQLPGGIDIRVNNVDEIFDKLPELVKTMETQIIANMPVIPAFKIGDKGPGGGIIFFAENGVYMECSLDIGSCEWEDAVSIARSYRGGNFRDWRLPTKGEFEIIYRNLFQQRIGGLSGSYWTSTEANDKKKAWGRFMGNDNVGTRDKTKSLSVRAIRSFNQ